MGSCRKQPSGRRHRPQKVKGHADHDKEFLPSGEAALGVFGLHVSHDERSPEQPSAPKVFRRGRPAGGWRDNRTGAAAWECRPRTCSLSVSCFLWRPDCEVMAPEVAGDRRVSVATHVARSSDCPASTPTPTWPTLESICYQRHRRAASELEAGCVQNGADPGTGPSSDG